MATLRAQRRGSQAGITLVELLVSVIILAIISTMLVTVWINLQRASATSVRTSNARTTARDAMSRISSELRGAQPTALPSAAPSPTAQPPVTTAAPMEGCFNSAFNLPGANADGSGVSALRPTRIWLDAATAPPSPWNPNARTLYWQRDMDGNGSFSDAGDRSIVLARNVANLLVPDTLNGSPYTPVFRYAYRDASGGVLWTDNADSSLDLASVVAVSVRLIIDKNMGGEPSYVDLTTTVRLRNASAD